MSGRTPAQALAIGGGAIVSALLVAVAGVKVVDVTAQTTKHYQASYAQPIRHVVVDSAAESVSVEGVAGSRTTVDTTISEAIRHPSPRVRVVGDTVHLSGGCQGFEISKCAVRYVVNAPSTVDITVQASGGLVAAHNLDADVSLNTASGRVAASNITGAVSLTSESGHISAAGMSGGPITLHTASGWISAADISADRISARTDSGRVSVALSAPPRSVSASSGSGSIDIVVPRDQTHYHLKTSSGDSSRVASDGVRNDSSSPRTIDASSGSGWIDISYAE